MILHQYDDQEPCQGMNCGTTTAQHSKECIAEHTAACAGGFFGKWLPIESAPKDGQWFTGWNALHMREERIHWQDFGSDRDAPVGWRDSFITVYREEDNAITHWRHPTPPPVSLNK
jgi:hypothetical protein